MFTFYLRFWDLILNHHLQEVSTSLEHRIITFIINTTDVISVNVKPGIYPFILNLYALFISYINCVREPSWVSNMLFYW